MLNYVKSQPKVDPDRVGILAQSFGTAVTVALAPEMRSLILMGSIAHPKLISGKPMKWEHLDYDGVTDIIDLSLLGKGYGNPYTFNDFLLLMQAYT